MAESDRLLVACPQCDAWPMAAGRPPSRWQNSREMIFRCPQCGRREVFDVRAETADGHLLHRPFEPRGDHGLRNRSGT